MEFHVLTLLHDQLTMSVLRTLRQLTTTSSRVLAVRQLSTVSHRALPTLATRVVSAPTNARAFSVSARKLGEGASDIALTDKLSEELKYEQESASQIAETPEFLSQFLKINPWEIKDTLGNDEVVMTRTFGNEKLRLMFSIADIDSAEEDFQSEESESEANETEEEDTDDPLHTYPLRASLSITKTNGSGCLNVDMICQEGHFVVENVSFYKDAQLGLDLSADADWKRRGTYLGPQFETLDVGVQEEFEKYLAERGVNETAALFIPEYAEFKEQKEYVSWLTNVKTFIEQ
ncbi:hypothetical protein DXG01_017209 [Tephrocybe rancida]|nr:hypothetical protein DXG01_017209 [Tephrocybe rancida]